MQFLCSVMFFNIEEYILHFESAIVRLNKQSDDSLRILFSCEQMGEFESLLLCPFLLHFQSVNDIALHKAA